MLNESSILAPTDRGFRSCEKEKRKKKERIPICSRMQELSGIGWLPREVGMTRKTHVAWAGIPS
jgi:hypothetical protein